MCLPPDGRFMALRSSEMKYGVRAPDRARSKCQCKEGKVIEGPSKEPSRAIARCVPLSLLVARLNERDDSGHALAPITIKTWSG